MRIRALIVLAAIAAFVPTMTEARKGDMAGGQIYDSEPANIGDGVTVQVRDSSCKSGIKLVTGGNTKGGGTRKRARRCM